MHIVDDDFVKMFSDYCRRNGKQESSNKELKPNDFDLPATKPHLSKCCTLTFLTPVFTNHVTKVSLMGFSVMFQHLLSWSQACDWLYC